MNDKALWEQFKTESETTIACPDILQLSAYMDKRLSQKEQKEIEAHLNQCEECLESTLSLFALQKEKNEALPMSSILSAQKLVKEPIQVVNRPWTLKQGIAASLFFMIVSFAGYSTGKTTYNTNDLLVQTFLDEDITQFSTALDEELSLFNETTIGEV